MSTGLLLFLVFMALSIIDSVARARRSQQQKQVPPPEDGADEEWRVEPSAQGEEDQAEKREPGEALGELMGLEKLMGPGYLDKLMGPGITGVIQDEEETPEEPAGASPPASDERRASSLGREERRAIARERRASDQERRRAEAGRPSRVERKPRPGRRRAVQGSPSEGDRRLRSRRDDRSRPASVARTPSPLQDSAVDRDRERLVPMPVGPPGAKRSSGRTRLYRELFGGGGRDSLRRAFILKEILDAPTSERPPDRREAS